jgi:MFS family permease
MSYRRNDRLSYLLSMTAGASLSSAVLVPFFNQNGLDQAAIQLLQAIFSIAAVTAELPTGYVADRFGRVVSVRAGAACVALGFLSYSQMQGFWQFVPVELLLATGFALLSGAHQALIYDGMLADGRIDASNDDAYRRYSSRVLSLMFGTTAVLSIVGVVLAERIGLASVIAIDGMLSLAGLIASFFMREPPFHRQDKTFRNPVKDMLEVIRYCVRGHKQLPMYIALGATLSAMTYFGFWLAPAYYTSLGISLSWFGVILAGRSAVKALLSYLQPRLHKLVSDRVQLIGYSVLGVAVYVALGIFRQPWAIGFMLGFDVIQALHGPVLDVHVQRLTPSSIRAQVVSVDTLATRGAYALLGPLLGLGIDRSIGLGMAAAAVIFASLCFVILRRIDGNGGI